MTGIDVFIRLDLPNGNRIGPDNTALLEAPPAEASITAAPRYLGMSYRRARLLVQEIETLGQMGYRNGDNCFPSEPGGCN